MLLRWSDTSDRVAAALLGRFLPRLGPLAPLAALFLGAARLGDSPNRRCDNPHEWLSPGAPRRHPPNQFAVRRATRRPPGRAAAPRARWRRADRPAPRGARPGG